MTDDLRRRFEPEAKPPARQALDHLATAETAILSWSRQLDEAGEDPDTVPSVSHLLYSVLSAVGKAVGVLEAELERATE